MKKILCCLALLSVAWLSLAGCSQPRRSASHSVDASPQELAKATAPEVDQRPPAGHMVASPVIPADGETATLKAKFIYDGAAPAPKKVDSSKDPFCAPLDITSSAMIIGKDGEIHNLAMYWDLRANRKTEIPESALKPSEARHKLDNRGCVFVPHMIHARPGHVIEVINSDQTGHNANFGFLANKAANNMIPAGGSKDVEIKLAEPAPIPVECNVHPWMKTYVIITDHPYVGITNDKGELTIEGLPVGEVVFKIWHENSDGSFGEIDLNGKATKLRRGQLEVDLKAGMNDLGTIKIAPDQFSK